ncbi:MAG: gliding motility-associated ABC transporter ATP-binding subunit GldA [Elusimicrobiota bacterium]
MLVFEGVSRNYGKLAALKNVSFSIQPGQLVFLLGANGAGKTTALRLAAGTLAPSSGRIMAAGGLNPLIPSSRAAIGYLPENNPLRNDMEAFSCLMERAELLSIDENRAAEVFFMCGLVSAAGKKTGELSRGYRQRLGLAMAIVGAPDLLLLDEPTSGLDPIQAAETGEMLRSLSSTMSILVSSHSIDETKRLADRILVIKNGELRSDLYRKDITASSDFKIKVIVKSGGPDLSALFSSLNAASVVKTAGNQKDSYSISFSHDARSEIFSALRESKAEVLEIKAEEIDFEKEIRELLS